MSNNANSFVVKDVKIGSITIELTSNVELIVLLVYALYKTANLYLDFQSKYRNNEKLRLEIAEKQKALSAGAKQREKLELEKLQMEINLLKAEEFKILENNTGVYPQQLLPEHTQEETMLLGRSLSEECDSLDLYVKIIEEEIREANDNR